jgi:hypothetical protein
MGEGSIEARAPFTIRVTTRNYLSSQHLWMARHTADRCATLEETLARSGVPTHPEHAGYAVAAITLSVAFLEGLINELFEDAQTRAHRVETLSKETARVMAEFWEDGERYIGTLDKYQLALLFNGADRFDRGAEPFQSARTLIALRNALSHFKPSTHDNDAPGAMNRRLTGLFAKSALLSDADGSDWTIWALAAPGARWAVETAKTFADAWSDRMGLPRLYETYLAAVDSQFPRGGHDA